MAESKAAAKKAESPTIWARLSAPLPKDEIRLRVGQVSPGKQKTPYQDGTKANFLAYHDARHVMERLDEVMGPQNWSDSYRELPGSAVECTLSLNVDGVWVSKSDVGYPNDPKSPEAEALKSSFSDALKRTGVKWGVGRYLYNLPESRFWPVDKWGKLSKENEAKVRALMFDGLEVKVPGGGDPATIEIELASADDVAMIIALAKDLEWDAAYLTATLKRADVDHPSKLQKAKALKMIDYMTGKVNEKAAEKVAAELTATPDEDTREREETTGPLDLDGPEIPF